MKNFNEKKVVIFLIIILIVLISIIFALSTIFGGAKMVANNYAKGMSNFDSKTIADLYIEEMILESYESKNAMIEEFDTLFQGMKDSYFQILKYDVDKNYKQYEGKELEYQKDVLVDYYKIDENEIKEIRRYSVVFYCSDDGENKEVETKLNIANIGNKWYLISTE